MSTPRFGAIGGNGWLGSALIRAALAGGAIAPGASIVSSRSGNPGGLEGVEGIALTTDSAALVQASDVILIAVRPEQLAALPPMDFSGKLVLSVMAMMPLERTAEMLGTARIIRAMPNAAAEFGQSFTPVFAGAEASAEDRAFAETFFGASGLVEWVEDESLIDYLTAMTGAGPAFFAALAAAMERDAVRRGLSPEAARRATNQLVKGAAPMLAEAGSSMQALVDVFLDYRGTTAAGIVAMQGFGLDRMVRAMFEAAEERAREGV